MIFNEIKLKDVCTKVTDGTHDSPSSVTSGGYPLIKGKDISNGFIDFDNCEFISREDHLKVISRSNPEFNDILFSNIGSVGDCIFVDTKKEFSIKNVALFKTDKKILNPKFLYYYVKNYQFQGEIFNKISGSAQPFASLNLLRDHKIKIPNIDIQNKIVEVLDGFESVFKNNLKIISLLDEVLKNAYEEWFVRYRVNGKKLELEKKTNLPKGWIKKSILKFNSFKKKIGRIKKFDEQKVYYATKDVYKTSIVGIGEKVDFMNKPSRAQIEPTNNSLWFARMSNTHKVLCFNDLNLDVQKKSILSTGFAGFEALDANCLPYLYLTINSNFFHDVKDLFSTGATQVSLTDNSIKFIKIVEPDLKIIKQFGENFLPVIKKITILNKKNILLIEAINILLPRILKGLIDIKKLS